MAEETKLHVTRLRAANSGGLYFDPETDIRRLFPRILDFVLEQMENEYESSEYADDVRYLRDCVEVFHIRMLEDREPMDSQLDKFLQAIERIPEKLRSQWSGRVVDGMLVVYALFCRRDAPTDASALEALMETSRLTSYRYLLDAGTYNRMKEELRTSVSLLVSNKTTTASEVVIEETGEHLTGLKELACRSMHVSGNDSWDAIAAKCDEGLSNGVGKSDRESIALALAYPVYRENPLTVELTNETDGKTGASPEGDEPGSVQVVGVSP